MDRTSNIKEYKLWRGKLLKALEVFDGNEAIIGKWTAKDVISHLTGWAKYQINLIEDILNSKEPQKWGDIDKFNEGNVEKEMRKSFDTVLSEYKKTSENLIKAYSNLPENLWNKQIWTDAKSTPEKLLNIEIRHIAKTHLPQILKSHTDTV